jgi:hypothetical protein
VALEPNGIAFDADAELPGVTRAPSQARSVADSSVGGRTPAPSRSSPGASAPVTPKVAVSSAGSTLSQLAAASPVRSEQDRTAQILERVQTDTEAFNLTTLQLDEAHKFAGKRTPAEALRNMPDPSTSGAPYPDVYQIYLRLFKKALGNVKPNTPAFKSLDKLCKALNIVKVNASTALAASVNLPQLLARLKAADICAG